MKLLIKSSMNFGKQDCEKTKNYWKTIKNNFNYDQI